MKDYVPSSPHFFRRVKISFFVFVGGLIGLAALIPAPLQGPADISRVPNPVKAAWFLLWAQELVSYSGSLVYAILGLVLFFFLLPFIAGSSPCERARWLPPDQKTINILTLSIVIAIIVLTIIAMFFRGENWSFVY